MKDVVLVPTFNRPEYLWLCLEHLAAADGGAQKHVRVYHDTHHNDTQTVRVDYRLTAEVVSLFHNKFADITLTWRKPHGFIGNCLNFLEAYREAYSDVDVRYVYLVEDDVLVSADFFAWHEAVQARGDYFVTVGWHCCRWDGAVRNNDPTQYIETQQDYSSIGVCWRREKLAPFVQHATTAYYGDHRNYLARAFPGNPINPGQWTEQAGIVTRMLHQFKNCWVAWPTRRRCSHVGVSGYHRPNGQIFIGPLERRVASLRQAVTDTRIVGMNHDFGGDIEPVLAPLPWTPEQLTVAQRLPYIGRI